MPSPDHRWINKHGDAHQTIGFSIRIGQNNSPAGQPMQGMFVLTCLPMVSPHHEIIGALTIYQQVLTNLNAIYRQIPAIYFLT